jgi:hypothetical protein
MFLIIFTGMVIISIGELAIMDTLSVSELLLCPPKASGP